MRAITSPHSWSRNCPTTPILVLMSLHVPANAVLAQEAPKVPRSLMEWVLLVGGVEQDEFNTSLGWLISYRLAGGMEIGVSPQLQHDLRRPTK